MADAAVAPAPVATPAAPSPEVVAAPAETPAKVEPPKRGKARHAEIKAKLAASTKPDVPVGDKPVETPTVGDKPTEDKPAKTEDKPKPAVGAVMRLTAENTKLKSRLDELESAVVAVKGKFGEETIASFRERVKKDPAILFETFGEDIDADENNRLTKLNDAVLARNDPEYAKQREVLSEIDALKKKLADRDAEVATHASVQRDRRAREHTSKTLTEGFKGEDGAFIVDPAKFPYVNHLTKTGEIDAHMGIMQATRGLVTEFRTAQKREPSEAEIHEMIAISAAQAEEHFAKRAKNWQLAQPAQPAPVVDPTPAAETRRTPTTIGSGLGGRGAGVDPTKLSKRERHALIDERLRQANRSAN